MARISKYIAPIENKTRMWKVGLYIRLSKDDGNEESYSVKNQKARLNKYLEENDDNFSLVETYVDDGYTGTDSNRDGFQKLLEDIKQRKINTVIVKDLSRLSRNYIEAGQYLEHFFIEYGVRFISLELPALDSYKNPDQMNSIMVPIQNVFNDEFCRQTSIKIRSVFDTKRKNGDYIGGFGPYGYLKDPEDKHHLIVDEVASEIIKKIFDWYVYEGMSKSRIAFRLNDMGIESPSAYKKSIGLNYYHSRQKKHDSLWSYTTIASILKNEMYLGHMVQGKAKVLSYKVHKQVALPEDEWFVVRNTHEPIIDEATFEKSLARQEQDTRVAPSRNKVYKWAGILRCYDCGMCMVRNVVPGKAVYYHCATYRKKSKTACTKHTIRAEILEETVLATIQSQIGLVTSMADIIDTIEKMPVKKSQEEEVKSLMAKHENERNKENELLDSLYLDWKKGNITGEQFQRLKDKTDKMVSKINDILEKLQKELDTLDSGITNENPYLLHFLKYRNIETLTRETLIDIVDTIYVHEGGGITIDFKYQDQLQLLSEYIESNEMTLKLKK